MANYCAECHNPIESVEVKDKSMLSYHPDCLKKKNGEKLEETNESDFTV